MRKQGVEDYRQKLLSHEGWSGDSATGHRGLPAKEKDKVDSYFDPVVKILKAKYPDAKIGYRGSLATGEKYNKGNPLPFDPTDFDVDAFIVSDELAALFPNVGYGKFKNGRIKSSEIKMVSDILDNVLKKQFP